jgi:hypothetical protein
MYPVHSCVDPAPFALRCSGRFGTRLPLPPRPFPSDFPSDCWATCWVGCWVRIGCGASFVPAGAASGSPEGGGSRAGSARWFRPGRDRRRMDVRRRTRAVPYMRRSALPSVLSGRIRPPAVFSGRISISRYVARFDVSYRIPGAVRTLTPAWVKFSGPADALPLCRPLPLICLLAP